MVPVTRLSNFMGTARIDSSITGVPGMRTANSHCAASAA